MNTGFIAFYFKQTRLQLLNIQALIICIALNNAIIFHFLCEARCNDITSIPGILHNTKHWHELVA